MRSTPACRRRDADVGIHVFPENEAIQVAAYSRLDQHCIGMLVLGLLDSHGGLSQARLDGRYNLPGILGECLEGLVDDV